MGPEAIFAFNLRLVFGKSKAPWVGLFKMVGLAGLEPVTNRL
jgi:hypothetical protein